MQAGNGTSPGGGRPLAVVTGASSGIGLELARVFAEHGYDLLINAEDAELEEAGRELDAAETSVEAVRADLTRREEVERLYEAIRGTGRPVDALALNAGIGAGGAFAGGTDLEQELELINLNVSSTVHLAKLVLPGMVERNEGKVLFTSSIASTMPGSFQAVYNASKSFVQSFALALRNELKDTGITITSLMPGPTDTEFFERADMEDTKVGAGDKDDPADVARQGFEALMSGKSKVIAGSLMNRVQGAGGRLIPDGAKAEMHRRMAEPGSAEK
jgi:short-subunit dehydrogenase